MLDMNCKAENRQETQTKAIGEVFREFCSKSSIHGVQYFFERRRHWSERLWWIIAFTVSVGFCGSSIQNIWVKWRENPVTVSFTEREAPISAIPFPTVTICPETKAYREVLNITKAYHELYDFGLNLTDIDMMRMEALNHICGFYFNLDLTRFGRKFLNESIYDVIERMAPSMDGTLYKCMWNYKLEFCYEYFTPVFTADGLCFTFNGLNSHEVYTEEMTSKMKIIKNQPNVSRWSLDNGYEDRANEQEYPARVFNANQDSGLIIFLRLYERDLEYLCRGPFQGYKLILSTPGDSLKTSRKYFRVSILEQVEIAVKPVFITTSEELRYIDPKRRQCYFGLERQLRFFKLYTMQNFETECLANFTHAECGCVKFSMPMTNTTRICGMANIMCCKNAERNLFGQDVIDGLKDNNARLFRENCNCLPACTTITYNADIDRTKFNWEATVLAQKIPVKLSEGMVPSTITIFFRDYNVVNLKRGEMYTITDFLAIYGGLLGLFLGVSALSIIEFIYYSTLHLFWTLRRRKLQNTIVPFNQKFSNSALNDISYA